MPIRRDLPLVLLGLCLLLPSVSYGKPDQADWSPPAGSAVIELGGKAAEVRTGGSGRFLIFRLVDSDKLIVLDVVAKKIVKEIPAAGDVKFAASADKLVVVLNNQRSVQRWDLKTLQREKTVLLPDDRPIRFVAMGSHGDGPLAVWPKGKLTFWDVETLKPMTVRGEVVDAGEGNLWPSADGRTISAWGWTSGPYQVMRLTDVTADALTVKIDQTPEGDSYNEAWAMPSADGTLLIRHGAQFFNDDLVKIASGPLKDSAVVPTGDPRFLIALRRTDPYKSAGNTAAIVAAHDLRVLHTITEMPPVTHGDIGSRTGRLGVEPRVRYLPEQKLLVSIVDGDDKVVVQPFDLLSGLKKTGADFLYVISNPAEKVVAGQAYRYQVEAISNAGGLKYKLEEAPGGMTVSPAGLLTWPKAGPDTGGRVPVILSIANAAGNETQHTIALTVERFVPAAGAAIAANSEGTIELLPASAKLSGEGLKLDKDGNVGQWTKQDATIEWTVAVAKPGWHDVTLTQAAQIGAGDYEIAVGKQVLQGKVTGTGGDDQFKTVHVGAVNLPAGQATVTLKATRIVSRSMTVKAIHLTPGAAPVAVTPPAATPDKPAPGKPVTQQPPAKAPTAKPPAGKPAGPDPAIAARFKGVWVASPTFDDKKVREMFAKDTKPEELEAKIARFNESSPRLRVIYAFDTDGTVIGAMGYGSPTGGRARWEITKQEKDVFHMKMIPDNAKVDEVEIRFITPDQLTMTVPNDEAPIISPLTFNRTNMPAPKVVERPAATRPAGEQARVNKIPPVAVKRDPVGPKGDPELTKIAKALAEALEKSHDDELGIDLGGGAVNAVGYGVDHVQRSPDGNVGRIILTSVEVRQLNKFGDSIDVMSHWEIDVQKQDNRWVCTQATKLVGFDKPGGRVFIITGDVRWHVLAAQGLEIPRAKELEAQDKPTEAKADEAAEAMAKEMATSFARSAAASKNHPDMGTTKVTVARVQPTAAGLNIVLSSNTTTVEFARAGPSEYTNYESVILITLRRAADGGWTCHRATSKLQSITSRRGPIGHAALAAEKDITASVQEWLDGQATATAKPAGK